MNGVLVCAKKLRVYVVYWVWCPSCNREVASSSPVRTTLVVSLGKTLVVLTGIMCRINQSAGLHPLDPHHGWGVFLWHIIINIEITSEIGQLHCSHCQ